MAETAIARTRGGSSPSIPVGRMAHALHFSRFLSRIGAPVERGFQAARLPFHAAAANLIVPTDNTWRFAGLMSRLEGIETLGLEVGLEFDVQGLAGPLWTRILFVPV